MTEQVSAARKLGPAEALALARKAAEVWVASGKKVQRFDMRGAPPTDEELLGHLLGRSGTLRAPTAIIGDRMLVGYSDAIFAESLS